jgi:hypothetical protein
VVVPSHIERNEHTGPSTWSPSPAARVAAAFPSLGLFYCPTSIFKRGVTSVGVVLSPIISRIPP